METDFDVNTDLVKLESDYTFEVYVPETDRKYLEDSSITRVVKADHTGVAKARYIFNSEAVEDRCGCGTSFGFEKKD